jgi:hypothetical protein
MEFRATTSAWQRYGVQSLVASRNAEDGQWRLSSNIFEPLRTSVLISPAATSSRRLPAECSAVFLRTSFEILF